MRWKKVSIILVIAILSLSACSSEKNKTNSNNANSSTSGSQEKEDDAGKVPPGTGEGAPSTEALDLKKSQEYDIGDVIKVDVDNISYEVTIDKVEYTDQRSEYVPDPGFVMLFTYTYTNQSDEALLIDDMRFQLMTSKDSQLFESYYFDEIKIPQAIGKGESCTAQVAYSLSQKEDDLVLAYQDTIHSEVIPAKILVNKVQ